MSAVKPRPKLQSGPIAIEKRPNRVPRSPDNRSVDRRPQTSSSRASQHRKRERRQARERQIYAESRKYDGPPTSQQQHSQRRGRKADQGFISNRNENLEHEEKPKRTRILYRRKKVLRKWVFPAIFLVPLGIIWLEYYIGKLIGLEDIRDVYQGHLVDPWDLLEQDFNASRIREKGSIPSLPKIAYAPRTQCPPGQRRMINIHNPLSHSVGSGGRLIPMIAHQQSKTRCLTMKVDGATTKWAMKRWSYYMHDEDSKSRLFETYCGGGIPTCEFPLLGQIVDKCFYSQTNSQNQHRYYSLKTELWKFLTLWIYGGVYVDIDFLPQQFSPFTITPLDDGYLLIDSDTKMLSTKFMAVSPRHPIMYYAVQQMLLSILMEGSPSSPVAVTVDQKTTANSAYYENGISGSSILTTAFRMFQEGDNEQGQTSNLSPGIFHGAMKRSVRLASGSGLNIQAESETGGFGLDLVVPIFDSETAKEVEFQKMGMTAEDAKEWGRDSTGSDSTGEGAGLLNLNHDPPAASLSCRQKLYHF